MIRDSGAPAQYDFRSPSQLAHRVREQFVEWQRAFCKLFSERLSEHLPFAIEFSFDSVDPQPTRETLATLSEGVVAFEFKLGTEPLPCLFTVSRQFLLVLVNGMLGEVAVELPADRNLTPVERALAEIVAEELAVAFAQAYVGEDPLVCQPAEYDANPQRTRIFPRDSITIVSVLHADASFGSQSCRFVLPYCVTDLLPQRDGTSRPDSSETRRKLESIVKAVPITLAIQLGSVPLKISEVANLQVGDVIILDQSAREPLVATIDDRPRFRVWPGKIGSRRACQIASDQ